MSVSPAHVANAALARGENLAPVHGENTPRAHSQSTPPEFEPARAAMADRTLPAPRSLRLAAVTLDVMLAFLLIVVLRVLVRLGMLPSIGIWQRAGESAWFDVQIVFLALGVAALRDVPTGASVTKWLLCMRLATPDGGRLGLGQRLLRAPISLLPFAWISREMQQRMAWRVVSYAPTRAGLALRAMLTVPAAVLSLGWAVETLRPSIGTRDADRLVESLVTGDHALQSQLGAPLDITILHVTSRAHQQERGQRATFELRVRGPAKQQDMTVHARRVDGSWAVEEVVDIQIQDVLLELREPVASR